VSVASEPRHLQVVDHEFVLPHLRLGLLGAPVLRADFTAAHPGLLVFLQYADAADRVGDQPQLDPVRTKHHEVT